MNLNCLIALKRGAAIFLQFFAGPIFRLTLLTFRPQNWDMGSVRRALSHRAALLEPYLSSSMQFTKTVLRKQFHGMWWWFLVLKV